MVGYRQECIFNTNFSYETREEKWIAGATKRERRVTAPVSSGFPYLCRRVQFGELNVFVQARR